MGENGNTVTFGCNLGAHRTGPQSVAAMLAALGIDADPAYPTVALALSLMPWRASTHPATSEPLVSAFPAVTAQTGSGRRSDNTFAASLPIGSGK